MNNASYNSYQIKHICENKLLINFRCKKEYNGWFKLCGRKATRITVPKGRKFIPPKTYQTMAKQLKLTTPEFDELLDCSLDIHRYKDLISERKQIPQ